MRELLASFTKEPDSPEAEPWNGPFTRDEVVDAMLRRHDALLLRLAEPLQEKIVLAVARTVLLPDVISTARAIDSNWDVPSMGRPKNLETGYIDDLAGYREYAARLIREPEVAADIGLRTDIASAVTGLLIRFEAPEIGLAVGMSIASDAGNAASNILIGMNPPTRTPVIG